PSKLSTWSAPRTIASGWRAATARAFASARRCARTRGSAAVRLASSTPGTTAVKGTPALRSRACRNREVDARMRVAFALDIARVFPRAPARGPGTAHPTPPPGPRAGPPTPPRRRAGGGRVPAGVLDLRPRPRLADRPGGGALRRHAGGVHHLALAHAPSGR